ncbi:MAG: RNA polymerase sigma factor [Candidatus Sumerlaeaceae bacterium]
MYNEGNEISTAGAGGCLEWLAVGPLNVIGSLMRLATGSQSDTEAAQLDCEVLRRISRGDSSAFEELMRQHGAALFSFLSRRVRIRETVEDLFQETWIRVINHAHTFRGVGSARPWLYRIALNALTDYHRRETAARRGGGAVHVDLDAAANVAAEQSVPSLISEQNSVLHTAVEELPEVYREVVRLRYFEELSTEEVAEVLECAPGTVKSRLSRGLVLLQSRLEELR